MAKSVPLTFLLNICLLANCFIAHAGNFNQDVDITWGDGRGKILDGGNVLSLTLDKASGSGCQSKQQYLFGRFDVQMKLAPGYTAGTVTTFYLSSPEPNQDEIDLEFLGNVSGSPYTLHTNVYTQGQGDKVQDFRLWFDPTSDFHTYSIIWNPQRFIILVDNIPIRVFENKESIGVPFLKRPMRVYESIWNGETWATRNGAVKIDWSKAPFTAYYKNFNAETTSSPGNKPWLNQGIGVNDRKWIRWAQKYYMIYNYCTDPMRHDSRRECSRFL